MLTNQKILNGIKDELNELSKNDKDTASNYNVEVNYLIKRAFIIGQINTKRMIISLKDLNYLSTLLSAVTYPGMTGITASGSIISARVQYDKILFKVYKSSLEKININLLGDLLLGISEDILARIDAKQFGPQGAESDAAKVEFKRLLGILNSFEEEMVKHYSKGTIGLEEAFDEILHMVKMWAFSMLDDDEIMPGSYKKQFFFVILEKLKTVKDKALEEYVDKYPSLS